MILSTCCYLKKDGKTLMLHRIKKQDDINQGKWIGIGGKLEEGESPFECVMREFYEETGLHIKDVVLKGYITFPGIYHGQDEGMFLYLAKDYEGELISNCKEGVLAWVDDKDLPTLAMWEGDRYFESWLSSSNFTEAKLTYQGDQLIDIKINQY